jgi:hypothetical protein
MSLFQAGAYQSKVLSYVVRQTRHWVEQGSGALRRLKVAATWGAQILLYPAYVTFQALRMAAAQGRQIWDLGVPAFRQALQSQPTPPPPPPVALAPTTETPLRHVWETIRGFELPTPLPVIQLPEPPLVDRPPAASGSLVTRMIAAIARWGQPLSPGKPALAQQDAATTISPPPKGCVQGIACCLVTRSLVLVTSQNEILDILTPAQQRQLRDRIIGSVADYYYGLKSEPRRPLLTRSRALIRASQPLRVAARSHLRALVVFLAALFQAGRQATTQLQSAQPSIATPPLPAIESQGLALSWTADLPVQQAFRLVQQFTLPAADRSQIRGIASLLETRSLVLVTEQNQILDVLTAEQQGSLRHRITWDSAHYGRYCQIRQSTRQALARLHSGGSDRILPPVRWLRGVMAWMQISPVAIAVNLFQEASLTLAPIVSLPSQFRQPPTVSGPLALDLAGSQTAVPVSLGSAVAWIADAVPALGAIGGRAMERFGSGTATRSPDYSTYIETPATPLGYAETPIEAILRGLDRALLWLEESLVLLWRWLRQQFRA